MNQLLNLKEKIQNLISKETEKNNYQKTFLNFLFTKLGEVRELETLERLKDYENGRYLKAYLFYQSIKRANYQPEHLKLTKLENIEQGLEVIEKDLKANEPKEKETKFEPNNQQLLTLLGEKIERREIKFDCGIGNSLLVFDEKGNEVMNLNLDTGKIEPDPAEEFLKKHGISKK